MRRFACALCALMLGLSAAACAEDIDEETLAAMEEPASQAAAIDEAADLVYAVADPDEAETYESRIDEGPRPAFVEQLLDIARAELGYTEGPNNFSKYGVWSGDPNAAWCAEFVCWCVNQLDEQNGTQLLDTLYPNYSGQNTGRDWFIKRGRFAYRKGNCPGWGYQWERGASDILRKGDFIPRSGDLVFFSYNEAGDTEHVALVEYCTRDSEGNVAIHVIEGNNPSSVQRNRYLLGNSQVLGFGLCEDVIGTTMRSGNRGDKVMWLQQSLNKLGLLDERHLTGAFGGNTRRAVIAFQEQYLPGKTVNGLADRETQQALERLLQQQEENDPDSWLIEE